LSWGNRMKSLGVVASAWNWINRAKRLFAVVLAPVAAFALLTAIEVPFASPAHAQVSCLTLPDNAITDNERWLFDTTSATCVRQGNTNPPPSGNGFTLLTDEDNIEWDRWHTTAVGSLDPQNNTAYAPHSVTSVGFALPAGNNVNATLDVGFGAYGLTFTNAAVGERTYVATVVKGGITYTLTIVGTFADAPTNSGVTHSIASMVITGGAFTIAPPGPTAAPRDDDAIRKQTQRVIGNFLSRRADQITLSEPKIIDRLRQPETGGGFGGPVNVTANGTGDNNQVAFSTSLRQMASAAVADKEAKAAGLTTPVRPPMLDGAMALGAGGADDIGPASFAQPYRVAASGLDVWAQGNWAHVDEANQESDLGLLYFGADYRINSDLLVGVLAQWDWMDQKYGASGIGADGQGWMAGPYIAARLHQNLFFDARAAWGQSDNNVNALGTFTDAFQTERWLAKGQLTGDFTAGNWRFNPQAAVMYFEEEQEAFVNQLGITIPGQTVSLGRVTFGPKVSYRYRTAGAVIEPHVSLTGIWDFESTGQVNVRTGQAIGTDDFRGRFEGGLSAFFDNGWSIEGTGFYDGIGAGDFDAYGASLAINAPLVLPTDGFGDVVETRIAGISVEAMALKRSDLKDVPLTGPGLAGTPPRRFPFVAFTTDELSGQDFSPGLRASVNANMFNQPIELSGFFLSTIERDQTKLDLGQGAASPENTNALFHPENDPGADIDSTNSENIYGLVAHHQTKLYGAEANVLNSFGIPGLSLGARGIYYGEELAITTLEEADDVPGGADANPNRDQVTIRTDNSLLGFQAGFQGMFAVNPYVSVGGSVEGGLYANRVERRRTFRSANDPARFQDNKIDDTVFAQAVEVNPRVEIRLSETMTLSAAGTFLWLNNVSDAVSHYSKATDLQDTNIRADEDVFFWGGSLGLKIALDNWWRDDGTTPSSIDVAAATAGASYEELDERIAELEATTARKGSTPVTFSISGWINQGILAWDDGVEENLNVVQFASARSRVEFAGSAKISRGWSAGYLIGLGLNEADSNNVSQLNDDGDGDPPLALREANWWIRSNQLGKVTVGLGSTATDNIILEDTGGLIPGVQNIATIGGDMIVRHSDEREQGQGALIERTTLGDFAAGASVDTLRRDVIRYDAPRFSTIAGNFDFSVAWGEDDFYDVAARYNVNFNDFRFRSGVGYLHDTSEPADRAGSERDRQEFKGSASIIHVPSGIFMTGAFVHREYAGSDPSDQAIFGENTTGLVTAPGTNRPDTEYRYFASGIRQAFSSVGDTSIYGEYGRVDDAITGLREAGLGEITDSRLEMVGIAVSQDLDFAGMDIYAGFRHFQYHTAGVNTFESPEPLTDLMLFFAGSRVKF